MKKKNKTYQEFANDCGSVRAAALCVGVNPSTYSRWITGISKPRGLAAQVLATMGVGPA